MHALFIVNCDAGSVAGEGDVESALKEAMRLHGVSGEVRSLTGEELREAARDAKGFDAVVACGGDGTINTIAVALSRGTKPLGIVPLGTHNHLARELGIPLDIDSAVQLLATAPVRFLHLAEVNGRTFLSFSGVGIHPDLVRHRDAQRSARGRSKWLAFVVAAWRMFTRFPLRHVRIEAGGRCLVRLTSSVFVVLSPLQAQVFGLADVSCTDRTQLNIYVARQVSRWGTLVAFVRAALGFQARPADFEVICDAQATLRQRRSRLRVSLDGEVVELEGPLHYRVVHQALRVLAPPPLTRPA